MAGLLQFQGSEIPESVRNAANKYLFGQEPVSMNQARAAQEAATKASQSATAKAAADAALKQASLKDLGKGLLSTASDAASKGASSVAGGVLDTAKGVGRLALGPVGTLAQGLTHSPSAEAPERYPAGYDGLMMAKENPEAAISALQFGKGVADRALGLAKENLGGSRKAPTQEGPLQRTASPSMIPMEPAKVAAVETVAAAAPEVEAGRQRIQQGALQGLQSGEVHVSDMAKAVVDADEQRSGVTMKPEEKTQAITAEIQAMKTMDKAKLSEYVSYALIAGGLLASVLDKSGQAGQAFHQSLNAQLDRNLQAGKMQAQIANNAAKLALEDRKVTNSERNTESQISSRDNTAKYQQGSLAVAEKNAGVNQQNANTRARSAAVAERQVDARIGLMGAANALRERDVNSKIAARQNKIDNPTGGDKGVPLSYKDNNTLVKDVYESQGLKVDPKLQSQIAGRLPTLQKKYPQLSQAELVELAAGEYETETDPAWFGNDTVRVRKAKGE